MSILTIVKEPDPILRKKSLPVKEVNGEIKKLMNLDKELNQNIKKERNSFYKLLDGKNKKIGIESFLNKIKPVWKD